MSSPFKPAEAARALPGKRLPRRSARWPMIVLALAVLLACAITLFAPRRALAADPIAGELSLSTSGGYLRLVLRFPQEVETQIRLSSSILVISFKEPVDVSVDRLNLGATDYIGAARRDPDGRAIRLALARKVTVNSTTAAEQVFIDLLPESWTGPPPALPREVVEDLARRTREAERLNRQQQQLAQIKKPPAVRVRVTKQPTFIRYVFELPELTGVSTDRGKDQLILMFAAPLKFDLAEALLDLPPVLQAIEPETGPEAAKVKFTFQDSVDVRTFREDYSYVVDITPLDGKPARVADLERPADAPPAAPGTAPPAAMQAPENMAAAPSGVPAAQQTPMAPAAEGAQGSGSQPPTERAPVMANTPAQAPSSAAAGDAPKAAAPGSPPRNAVAEAMPIDPRRPVAPTLARQGDSVRLRFPFAAPTPGAVFQRGDTVWLVFDTAANFDLASLNADGSGTIRSASVMPAGDGRIVRLKLERPRLMGVSAEGTNWTVVIGDAVTTPSRPLGINRSIIGPSRSSITIPIDDPRRLHRIVDPEIGDTLLVITVPPPARGFLKTQEFVELRALASTHGIAVEMLADDLSVELAVDKVVITRPGGLALSNAGGMARSPDTGRAVGFDTQRWGFDRQASFIDRQVDLIRAAAEAPSGKRTARRLELARFYLAQQMFVEAKAVLDVIIADDRPTAEDPTALVLRAIANLMFERIDAALKDLSNPAVGNQQDAQLWRAIIYARQGKWAESREAFRHVEAAMGALPIELQLVALRDAFRVAIEVGDLAQAARRLNDIETVGVPPEFEAVMAVLIGRLAEGMGRREEALTAYHAASESPNRPAAAQGRLRELMLRFAIGNVSKTDAIAELETLTATWRGDETEVQALQHLARFYTDEARYRDAFNVMRTAFIANPHSEVTRLIQDRAMATFETLFLLGKGDALPAIDALSLFYDFRDLVPIGRRGDEMIRRLADRLVAVDLLEQAAELLQHQVDHRLQGAARAQVATKLAVIYLLNQKPDMAQAALRATRTADVSNELRNQRILIEARAISDIGRHDLALEVVGSMEGREALRLRSDILWAARRWQNAAEQLELLHGDRWQEFEPLSDVERIDILRAGIGYAFSNDEIGTARLKEKYAAKMAEGADRRAFEIVTGGYGTNSAEFKDIVRKIAAIDLLDNFLREMRARYPELAPAAAPPNPQPAVTPEMGAKPPA